MMTERRNQLLTTGDVAWITMRALAGRWNVSYDSIRREVLDGKIPSLKIRSEHRIAVKWIEETEHKALGAEVAQLRKSARRAAAFAVAGKDHFPDC